MSPQLSIPVVVALIAFFIADSDNRVAFQIFQRTLTVGNRVHIEERLSKLGRKQEEDYENFRISQLAFIAIGILFSTITLLIGLVSWITYGLSLVVISFGVLLSRNAI